MASVSVTFNHLDSTWTAACKQAVTHLNLLFKKNGIGVVLTPGGGTGPTISVGIDASIGSTIVHGKTSAETDGANRLIRADVKLPAKVEINTPGGIRKAGAGIYEFIVAHEFVHALGHEPHNSHLMAQTLNKDSGSTPAGDKLVNGGIRMPPLALSDASIDLLKGIWP